MATAAISALALDATLHQANRRRLKLQLPDTQKVTHQQRLHPSARWALGTDGRLRQTWSQPPHNQRA